MDQAILVRESVEAGSELVRTVNPRMPISAAFWLKEFDEPRWYLYLASDVLENRGSLKGYQLVREALDAVGGVPGIDLFQVKVVPSSNPFAREAAVLARQSFRNAPIQLGTTPFGGRTVEDVYIYPNTVLDPVEH